MELWNGKLDFIIPDTRLELYSSHPGDQSTYLENVRKCALGHNPADSSSWDFSSSGGTSVPPIKEDVLPPMH